MAAARRTAGSKQASKDWSCNKLMKKKEEEEEVVENSSHIWAITRLIHSFFAVTSCMYNTACMRAEKKIGNHNTVLDSQLHSNSLLLLLFLLDIQS
jgi:hypothetical protein